MSAEQTSAQVPVLNLLRQQRDLYRRLEELGARQRTLISGERPELLLDVLRERQTLVAALARINNDLAPYRADWQGVFGGLSSDVQREVQSVLDEINGLLATILHCDREDSSLLAARKEGVAGALGNVNGGRAANAAYARQARGRG